MTTIRFSTLSTYKTTTSRVFVLCLISVLLSVTTVSGQVVPLDDIAAIVNNDVVMISEVKRVALQSKQNSNNQAPDKTLLKDALETLILEKVQLQRAKALGIVIDDVAVNRAMLSIAERNNLDLEKFRIALIREGHNYKDFRENIREKLYLRSLRSRQKNSRKPISESEVDDLIRAQSQQLNKDVEYHLIDIFVPAPNGTSVQKFNALLKHTQSLRKQLLTKAGQIPQSTLKKMGAASTDLGWKNIQSLSPAFVRSLSLLGEGEMSNVVRDARGFHILKIVEQRGGKKTVIQHAQVRHILISSENPQARVKATILRNRILAGEDFAKLARENSADKGSAAKGGDLGMMDPSSFVPPFAKSVKTLPLNSLSQPVQTRFGWHLIEVLKRKNSDQTRQALKLQAQSLISKEKQGEEFNNWLQSIRDAAYIEYRVKL